MLRKGYVRQKKDAQELIYINCAAVVHTEHFYHVEESFTTNVLGMQAFLEQGLRVGVDKFINCSTSEVYSMNSWNETGGVCEDDFLTLSTAEHSQRTSYATGKLLTEFFMKDAVDARKTRGCSIRFANVYSRNERYPKHIIPHIINSLWNTGKVVLLENARRNRRTFLHNRDSCNAVLALLDEKSALDGSIYNVATNEEISILELVALCAKKMGMSSPKIEFSGYRPSDPERRILSTKKICERTFWRPHVTLSEGLDECIESYCGDGK
ncbi:MAG: NAD(P)-dependent oxidoreductase [Selenomonadaceae bacterium]|nr:NAD(P)-dependent oxidoreductase [Selenomonadaceae bacterium]